MTDICDANAVTNPENNNFRCVQNSQGAKILASLYELERRNHLNGSSTNEIISNIVSYGFTVATLKCEQAYVGSQSIDNVCENDDIGAIVGDESLNQNCRACVEGVRNALAQRTVLEQQAVALNPNYTPQTISEELQRDLLGAADNNNHDGVCRYMCKQCVVERVSQDSVMRITSECSVTTETFRKAFVYGMRAKAAEELKSRERELELAGYNTKKDNALSSLSYHMVASIQQMTRNELLNNLQLGALAMQELVIQPSSTSLVVSNVDQSITLNMLATLTSRLYSDASVKGAINNDLQAELAAYKADLSNLFDSIILSYRTIEELASSSAGLALLILGGICLTAVVAFFLVYKFVLQKNKNQDSSGGTVSESQQRQQLRRAKGIEI